MGPRVSRYVVLIQEVSSVVTVVVGYGSWSRAVGFKGSGSSRVLGCWALYLVQPFRALGF